ncbi:MAG: heavy metal-associated domain-containing protein [Burkholderiaceae bacterium]
METYKLDVKGMTCGGCTSSVQRAITGLNGVEKVEVTLQPGSATVEADPARVTAQQIVSTLAAMGFEARERA